MELLPAIADDIFVGVAVLLVGLSLAPSGTEEALLALATAAHTRRVVGVINAAEVASHLAAATWNARLVDALMLRVLRLPRSRRGGLLLLSRRLR